MITLREGDALLDRTPAIDGWSAERLLAVRYLDLGCGSRPYLRELPDGDVVAYVGLDVRPPAGGIRFNVASGDPWPFADGQLQELYSSHLVEHLPATEIIVSDHWKLVGNERAPGPTGYQRLRATQDALFWFMEEAWRVTKLGGRFELRWPALVDRRPGHGYWSLGPFVDPTHRRFIPLETFQIYFSTQGRAQNALEHYGLHCNWLPVEYGQGELGVGLIEERLILQRGPG